MSKRLFGLERSRRHAQALWQLDCDYSQRLTDKDRKWLSRFLHEYYLSAPNSPDNIHPQELMREQWRAHKRNKMDVLTQAEFTGREEFTENSAPTFDMPADERPDQLRAISMAKAAWDNRPPRDDMKKDANREPIGLDEMRRMGGLARAKALTKEQRRESASKAARERWFREKQKWPACVQASTDN